MRTAAREGQAAAYIAEGRSSGGLAAQQTANPHGAYGQVQECYSPFIRGTPTLAHKGVHEHTNGTPGVRI